MPPPAQMLPPSYSHVATTGSVPACYLPRLSRLEQIIDVQNAQLHMLEEKVVGLTERAEEAEERLTGMEMFGVELEDQVDTLQKRHDAVEKAVEVARDREPELFAPPEVQVKQEPEEEANGESAVLAGDRDTSKRQREPEGVDADRSLAAKRRLCNTESDRPSGSEPESKKQRPSSG